MHENELQLKVRDQNQPKVHKQSVALKVHGLEQYLNQLSPIQTNAVFMFFLLSFLATALFNFGQSLLFSCCIYILNASFLIDAGGDGGRGGDVILECSTALWDFSSLNHHIVRQTLLYAPARNILKLNDKLSLQLQNYDMYEYF